jgi:hypothetical protein
VALQTIPTYGLSVSLRRRHAEIRELDPDCPAKSIGRDRELDAARRGPPYYRCRGPVVAESHAPLVADYVRFFARERENVGQKGFDLCGGSVSFGCRITDVSLNGATEQQSSQR